MLHIASKGKEQSVGYTILTYRRECEQTAKSVLQADLPVRGRKCGKAAFCSDMGELQGPYRPLQV